MPAGYISPTLCVCVGGLLGVCVCVQLLRLIRVRNFYEKMPGCECARVCVCELLSCISKYLKANIILGRWIALSLCVCVCRFVRQAGIRAKGVIEKHLSQPPSFEPCEITKCKKIIYTIHTDVYKYILILIMSRSASAKRK